MCGLAGFFDLMASLPPTDAERTVRRMADAVTPRGPDDGQIWADADVGIALGFRRLAIRDLTPAGRQPMTSADGRYVIVFNGEVYNADDLRPALAARGIAFRGHSDTEVILEACAARGAARAVQDFIGMFAIALWDREQRTLTLLRDRVGIKPLYYGRFGDVWLFGSQPRSLAEHPAWRAELDRDSLAAYLRYGYVPAPRSIYRNLRQLPPGHMVVIDAAGRVSESRYWDLQDIAAAGVADPLDLSDAEAADRLDTLLRDAVRRRMLADVPLGAFLSGGIDSSLVVALMQAQSERPVKTYSIGFHEARYNEAEHARRVAAHLGTEHHELYVEPGHALEVIPDIPEWYDEPFADSSQIPTFLVSELTRKHVTVALSGDGGDELFAGYNRYARARELLGHVQGLPDGLRRGLAAGLRAVPTDWYAGLGRLLTAGRRGRLLGDRAERMARLLDPATELKLYRDLVAQWPDPAALVPGSTEPESPLWQVATHAALADPTDRMQLVDMLTYLPDDILTKVDRASMAVSLEVRVPILDHRVLDLAWRLPQRFKVRDGETKWLLRQVLYRYVPRALIERPKMGFGVPVDEWLRGPLRAWAEDLLSEHALAEDGLLDPKPIRALWAEHLTGGVDWQYRLWVILMFQAWRRRWRPAIV
jgi:asparagine synthase (glutamine-hydrolysing)